MQWVVHEVPPEMSGTGSGRAERLGADMLGVGVGLGGQLPKWPLLEVMVPPCISGTLIILPN